MTADEAIETLELNHKARGALGSDASNTPLIQAQRLGLEALKRERDRRPLGHPDPADLLLGETQK